VVCRCVFRVHNVALRDVEQRSATWNDAPVASARATNSNFLRMPIGRLSACTWIESEASY
jgi:hypothetical protein